MIDAAFSVEEGVGRIGIQREEALNAVDLPTKRAIVERVREYGEDDDVRAILFESEGDRAFCAGGDLGEVVEQDYALAPFAESWGELFEAMWHCGKPTVAKVDGYALGGGFDLVMHTDLAVAAEDAALGQPEVSLGIVNHFSPPLLRESVGLKKTMDLMLTGETVSGAEAAELGLVARSVPREQLDAEVASVLDSLTSKSPRVLRKLKEGIYETLDQSPTAAREHLESVALEAVRTDPDYREGVDAQREDREPEWPADGPD